MCRFLAYQGQPVLMESVVSKPCHSLIHQSMQAHEAKTTTNGDGFGLGWYGERPEPGIYRDLRPAWSDENLLSICAQVRSPLFFAHVRAATGTATSRPNCHPFCHGTSLFMHNGQIGGYHAVRRQVEALIPDSHYAHRHGTTDSEAIFLAAVARGAANDALRAFAEVLSAVRGITQAAALDAPLRFAAAFTNGHTLWAFRWACDDHAPTLYWRHEPDGLHVVSEPWDDRSGAWHALPQGSALIADRHGAPRVTDFRPACG
ncbi:MAG: class II glutamine amidotransferase [Hyphomicrobiales bacterium]|uniref:class II glutamine amidotransferase n=1 Tax=Rhabdaerophilum calidifontis TaxID=2604328 RepID=UPI00123B5A74|nr:class II glutamine amidotransferase [Rhabdaerophilum calidifontis]MCA1952233.1 class II glutamine amidotransferase [Hyphomicrobiales bacterium]